MSENSQSNCHEEQESNLAEQHVLAQQMRPVNTQITNSQSQLIVSTTFGQVQESQIYVRTTIDSDISQQRPTRVRTEENSSDQNLTRKQIGFIQACYASQDQSLNQLAAQPQFLKNKTFHIYNNQPIIQQQSQQIKIIDSNHLIVGVISNNPNNNYKNLSNGQLQPLNSNQLTTLQTNNISLFEVQSQHTTNYAPLKAQCGLLTVSAHQIEEINIISQNINNSQSIECVLDMINQNEQINRSKDGCECPLTMANNTIINPNQSVEVHTHQTIVHHNAINGPRSIKSSPQIDGVHQNTNSIPQIDSVYQNNNNFSQTNHKVLQQPIVASIQIPQQSVNSFIDSRKSLPIQHSEQCLQNEIAKNTNSLSQQKQYTLISDFSVQKCNKNNATRIFPSQTHIFQTSINNGVQQQQQTDIFYQQSSLIANKSSFEQHQPEKQYNQSTIPSALKQYVSEIMAFQNYWQNELSNGNYNTIETQKIILKEVSIIRKRIVDINRRMAKCKQDSWNNNNTFTNGQSNSNYNTASNIKYDNDHPIESDSQNTYQKLCNSNPIRSHVAFTQTNNSIPIEPGSQLGNLLLGLDDKIDQSQNGPPNTDRFINNHSYQPNKRHTILLKRLQKMPIQWDNKQKASVKVIDLDQTPEQRQAKKQIKYQQMLQNEKNRNMKGSNVVVKQSQEAKAKSVLTPEQLMFSVDLEKTVNKISINPNNYETVWKTTPNLKEIKRIDLQYDPNYNKAIYCLKQCHDVEELTVADPNFARKDTLLFFLSLYQKLTKLHINCENSFREECLGEINKKIRKNICQLHWSSEANVHRRVRAIQERRIWKQYKPVSISMDQGNLSSFGGLVLSSPLRSLHKDSIISMLLSMPKLENLWTSDTTSVDLYQLIKKSRISQLAIGSYDGTLSEPVTITKVCWDCLIGINQRLVSLAFISKEQVLD